MSEARVAAVNRLTGEVWADRGAFLPHRYYAFVAPDRKLRGVYSPENPRTFPDGVSVGDLIVEVREARYGG